MSHPPTNYSPTLARLLTAPERCKQSRGKRQAPAATVVSSNAVNTNLIIKMKLLLTDTLQ